MGCKVVDSYIGLRAKTTKNESRIRQPRFCPDFHSVDLKGKSDKAKTATQLIFVTVGKSYGRSRGST
jgi:hypothetical protein